MTMTTTRRKTMAGAAWRAGCLLAALAMGGGCGGDRMATEQAPDHCPPEQPVYQLSAGDDYIVSSVSMHEEDGCQLDPARMVGWKAKVLEADGQLGPGIIVPYVPLEDPRLGFAFLGSIHCNVGLLTSFVGAEAGNGCSFSIFETAVAEVQADDEVMLSISRLETDRKGCPNPVSSCTTNYELEIKRVSEAVH